MVQHRFVGVTYGEFQALYGYGQVTVPWARVTNVNSNRKGKLQRKKSSDFVKKLPQLMLDDQEGVLILEIDKRGPLRAAGDAIISMEEVREVVPGTERARRILEPRLRSFGVEVGRARVETHVVEEWSKRNVANAHDGGDALCRLLFEEAVPIGKELRNAAGEAIRALDRQDGQPDGGHGAATWVPFAFRFTRHDPYDHGNVNYLIDAGKVISELSWPSGAGAVDRCREVVREMVRSRSGCATLATVVNDAQVTRLASDLRDSAPERFPTDLRALVIFCRWKELFHNRREAVDLEALAGEAGQIIAEGATVQPLVDSTWLLGCFAGHERVAHLRYAAARKTLPWFRGPALSLTKIRVGSGDPTGDHGTADREEAMATARNAWRQEGKLPFVGASGPQTGGPQVDAERPNEDRGEPD